jgi:uncharacterized protein (DUF2141 family)
MKAIPAALSALILAAGSGSAATAGQQTRDAARFVFQGTGVVTGTVVLDDAKRPPLRRALVTLTRPNIEDIRTTATDDQGRFAFRDLPAGTFALSASKGGFIGMSYGAPKPGMPGQSIVLAEGETYSASPIALIRGAVIAGRLLDRSGGPVAGARIEVVQFVTIAGERRRRVTPGAPARTTTNDHGEYRIHGLPPGEYLVFADVPPTQARVDVTAAELAWVNQPIGPAPAATRPHTYAPTLFPGVGAESLATPVTVARGEERLGIDITLQYIPVGRINGTVTEPGGRPAAGVSVQRTAKTSGDILPVYFDSTSTAADGSFTLMNVPAGDWVLTTRGGPPDPNPSSESGIRASLGIAPMTTAWWGSSEVTAAGADVAGIAIRMQPGMTFSGQFVMNGSAPRPEPARLRVSFSPALSGAGVPRGMLATADGEGRFRIEGVVPGRYRLQVPAPAPPWSVRSAMLGDRDLIDVPFEIKPGQDIAAVTITLTDSQSELAGRLTDAAARPAQLYVLVFSTDRTFWGTASRRVASARSRDDGEYTITGLPPGEYFLCALTEIDSTRQTSDPSYFEDLAPAAIKITVGEGERKRQDLRVGR